MKMWKRGTGEIKRPPPDIRKTRGKFEHGKRRKLSKGKFNFPNKETMESSGTLEHGKSNFPVQKLENQKEILKL